MALINSNNTRRIVPPHEPESFFDVRPIRAGDFEGLQTDGSQVTLSLDLLASLIVSWSYSEPVDRENVATLDLDTFTWLSKEILTLSGVRDDESKKNSVETLSPSTLQPSPVSNGSLVSSVA